MTYHIHITAETLPNTKPLSLQTFADLVHSLGKGLGLHITEVRTDKVLTFHMASFRGPRKSRVSVHVTEHTNLSPE